MQNNTAAILWWNIKSFTDPWHTLLTEETVLLTVKKQVSFVVCRRWWMCDAFCGCHLGISTSCLVEQKPDVLMMCISIERKRQTRVVVSDQRPKWCWRYDVSLLLLNIVNYRLKSSLLHQQRMMQKYIFFSTLLSFFWSILPCPQCKVINFYKNYKP